MPGNTFGRILRLTTFGESHGTGIGGVLDGCPAGMPLAEADMQTELDLRRPGQGKAATKRSESDRVSILSGVFDGVTTGTPIAFFIANENQRPADYGQLARLFRPGHADYAYFKKFGVRDYRGGGRASGRETAARVAGGAIAKKLLREGCGAEILAACVELGGAPAAGLDMDGARGRPYFAADAKAPTKWDELVEEARKNGDTLGGIVAVCARNVPAGLGEPVFDKLDAVLAHALMSVGAVKGVEVGDGFSSAASGGQANNDPILPGGRFASNHAGGILGGISTGQEIWLRAAVKPIASIPVEQQTVDVDDRPAPVRVGGRHDLSAIPRVVPVLSAMTALALADAWLLQKRQARLGSL